MNTEKKNFDKDEFMTLHNAVMRKMKMELGQFCMEVRTRNGFSRESVEFECGISERSIYKIEVFYNTSIDLVSKLFQYYDKQGYITEEEKEKYQIMKYFEPSLTASPRPSPKEREEGVVDTENHHTCATQGQPNENQ